MADHRPRRPRRRPGENRRLLVQAGVREFGVLGYHGASTGAIAARAGVPQPHVYASFTTKHTLFIECVQFVLAALAAGRDDEERRHERTDELDELDEYTEGYTDEYCLLLLQAVAAGRDPVLRAETIPLIREFRDRVGERVWTGLLERAAGIMLKQQ